MNNLKIFLCSSIVLLLQFGSISIAQETVPEYLFLFGQIDVSSETTITHTLTANATIWELYAENEEFPISYETDWEEAYAIITGSTTSNPSYSGDTAWKGFAFGWAELPYENTDSIAHGIYKATNSYNSDYFYIDIRDCNYTQKTFLPYSYNPDFYIRFDDGDDIFEWRRSPSTGSWTTISTGDLLKVWDICNNGTLPKTDLFEDFWDNALVMTNNGSNNPQITWGRHPSDGLNFVVDEYKIYRAITFDEEDEIVFTHIESVDGDILEYADYDVEINSSSVYKAHYKVTATYNDNQEALHETSPTNIVWIFGSLGKVSASYSILVSNSLFQNYPNPFNPVTTINYSVKNSGFVTLNVYDILGTEVATLVDAFKQAGGHSVLFDASELPSGIYFYRLTSENYNQTRKMILLR